MVFLFGIIFLTGCNRNNDDTNDIENHSGVILRTERSYYAEGTLRVLAFWENNSEHGVTYGQSFILERYNDKSQKWGALTWKDGYGAFTMEALGLEAGWIKKHTYNFYGFEEELTEGRYRIKTSFTMDGKDNDIAAEFLITKDSSLLEVSELDFSDLKNSKEIPIWFLNDETMGKETFPVRAYKNEYTFDTTIVIEGKDYYTDIAKGTGNWGIVQGIFAFKEDGNIYLVYAFSRDVLFKGHTSYIGVFDLTTKKETYISEGFKKYDIAIGYREGGIFNASFMEYEESIDAGFSAGSVYKNIGDFTIQNGELIFID